MKTMNKCRLCQQIHINLTNIYSYRTKSLAQTVLKLKGFKDSLDINKTLVLCENCKQGIENVALFWENIPEAKPGFINNTDFSGESEKQNIKIASTEEFQNVKLDMPAIALMHREEQESIENKVHSIKIRIKPLRKPKNKKVTSAINSDVATDSPHKRIKRLPKRFEDFQVSSTDKSHHSFEENSLPAATEESNEMCFNNLPEIALLRLSNGRVIGKLAETESKGMSTKVRISCQVCFQVFLSEKVFRKHFQSHNTCELKERLDELNIYMFYCQLCDKSFNQHYGVRRHFKSAHSEERPFICQHCEANFKYKFNLDYHMSKHIPRHRFECTFCKKRFVMRYELKIHLRTHTKERPYNCKLCPQAFAHISNLKTHQRVKHTSNLQDSSNSEKTSLSKELFKPPEILLEQTDLSNQSSCDSIILPSFESFNENIKQNNIEITTEETKNSLETVVEYDCEREEKDDRIVRAKDANESLKLQPKLGVFQLDSSILKVLPSVTILGLKKWPKFFQSSSEEPLQVVKKSTLYENKKSNRLDVKQSESIYNERRQVPVTKHMPSEMNDNNSAENSYTGYTEHETADNISNSFDFVTNRSSTISSNLKATNVQVSCDTINSDKSVTSQDKDSFSDIKSVQIQSTSNKSLSKNSKHTNNSQSCNEIKVSTRSVKLKHLLNYKPPIQNSFKNNESALSNDDSISNKSLEIIANKTFTNVTTAPANKELTNNQIPNNGLKNFSNSTQLATQSLLKPVFKNQQVSVLSLTKNSGPIPNICNTKPVITKVEIFPPLKTLPTIQNTFLTEAPTNIIKLPAEHKFQCPYCYKHFKQKSPLNKHLRTHTGEKPYKCNLCPKSYADPSNFKKHKILHKNAAESLNISRKSTYAVQSSPAYSTVSDPDPDGIEVMQTLKKFECSSTEEDDIDDETTTSSNNETQMWHNALEHALNSEEIRENIRNLVGINNVILPKSMQQITNTVHTHKNFSADGPD